MTRTAPAATRRQRSLEPVVVTCRRCGGGFTSRARHMVTVRCAHCGHANRVRRDQPVHASPTPPAAEPVIPRPAPSAARPPAPVAAAAGDDALDDDDGETYIRDGRGQLVLAEWTGDGRLVPARLSPGRQRQEMIRRGYQENPDAPPGGCHITETQPVVQPCPLAAAESVNGLRVCSAHHHALTSSLRFPATSHT